MFWSSRFVVLMTVQAAQMLKILSDSMKITMIQVRPRWGFMMKHLSIKDIVLTMKEQVHKVLNRRQLQFVIAVTLLHRFFFLVRVFMHERSCNPTNTRPFLPSKFLLRLIRPLVPVQIPDFVLVRFLWTLLMVAGESLCFVAAIASRQRHKHCCERSVRFHVLF